MNKCKGCQWYGKPYWSIINPCDNCPRENTNVEIFTRWQDTTIEELKTQLQQKENIIKEVRKSAKRELKIAEENIKNSEKWLNVEEEQEHAKRDIHTGKIVKRYMEMFLEILDKENK